MAVKRNKTVLKDTAALPFDAQAFFGKEIMQSTGDILNELELPLISRYESGVTHRVLNWWIKDEVIPSDIQTNRKFTFAEYIWVKIAGQIRELGVSLNLIKLFKDHFLAPVKLEGIENRIEKAESILKSLKVDKQKRKDLIELLGIKKNSQSSATVLQFLLVEYFRNRKPIDLLIFSDGTFLIEVVGKENLLSEADRNKIKSGHYIKISLTNLIKKFLLSPLTTKVFEKISFVLSAEQKAFEALNSDKLKKIVIEFKAKKDKPLEIAAGKNSHEKLTEVLFYQKEKQIDQIIIMGKEGETFKYDYSPKKFVL